MTTRDLVFNINLVDKATAERIDSNLIFFGGGASKSLQMAIAAMKLKDSCSLEEKL